MKKCQNSIKRGKKHGKYFRKGRAAIPVAIGVGAVLLTGGLAVPAFLGSLGVTASMATSAMFMAGAMLGTILFAQKSKTGDIPSMSSYPVQRANKGTPIPKIYGTARVAGNILWMGDNHPWVKKESSGGKGGGGGSQVTDQGNRRSFLIGICEGPAAVLRIWKGKEEISISSATFFEGDGEENTGINALTGEDYSNYPNTCCAFFDEFEIGTGGAIPNFTFEVLDESLLAQYPELQAIPESYVTNRLDNIFDEIEVVDPQGTTPISNEAELLDIGVGLPLNGSYYLTSDIIVTGIKTVALIGTSGNEFRGIFDGRGHKITYVLDDGGRGANNGLFFELGAGSLVQNLLIDATMTVAETSAPLSSLVSTQGGGVPFLPLYIKNVHCRSIINAVNTWPSNDPSARDVVDEIGGFVSKVSAWRDEVDDESVNITDCTAVSTITWVSANDSATEWAGFVAGFVVDYSFFTNCHSRVTLDTSADPGGRSTFGGFVVGATQTSFIKCSADITANVHEGVGGFAADSNDTNIFDQCFSIGTIQSDSGGFHSGGFIDEDSFKSVFTNCYSKVDLSGSDVSMFAGGFIGSAVSTTNLTNCYSIGVVEADSFAGGFCGTEFNSTMTSCYWDTEASGLPTSEGDAVGKTTAQMQTANTFTNWDFSTVWQMFSKEATDVNPALIIKDLLTNDRYGAGIDESTFIDSASFLSVENYCDDNDLLFSFSIDSQKAVLDWIDFINSHFQGYLSMSQGKIRLGVFKNETAISPGITRDKLVIEEGENPLPPVSIKKRSYSETVNRVEIAWRNRAKNYDTSIAIAQDEVDQRVSGKIRKKTIQLIGIMNADLAQATAYKILFDSMYRFSIYNFTLSYQDMLFEVGDVTTLTDGFLITDQKIRMTSIEEDKDGRGLICEAVEDKSHIYETFSYNTQDSERIDDSDQQPTLASPTATFTEDLNTAGLAMSIVPGGADTNGWHVYRSYDDATYELLGQANIVSVTDAETNSTGAIQSNLPAHTAVAYAGAESFLVNIGTITDLDTGISDEQFFNNKRLCKIGNEIIAYKTCVETNTAGVWRVTGLIRGLLGTEAVQHLSGEVFWTINNDFSLAIPDSDIGKTLYFKFLTFFGNSLQDISAVSSISYTVSGKFKRPMPLSLMHIHDRDGQSDYETDDAIVDFHFASKTAGFNIGGHGDVLWDSYEADPAIQTMNVKLKQTDNTLISENDFDITEIGTPMAVLIEDADRDGNNPFIVELKAGSSYSGIGSREIQIEQV